jgi:hypothetical protein
MVEQARASRERAEFYRQLAKGAGRNQAAVFENSARELEDRAVEMEKYARWFFGPGESEIAFDDDDDASDPEASDRNVVHKLHLAIEVALAAPKKPA